MKKLDTLLTKQLDVLAERVADRVLSRLLPLFARITHQMSQMDDQLAHEAEEVAKLTDVVASATSVMNSFGAKLQAAVDAALAAGATPAQLQAVSDLTAAIDSNKDALAAAIASQTS